jgi:hypothetical protein
MTIILILMVPVASKSKVGQPVSGGFTFVGTQEAGPATCVVDTKSAFV